MSDLDGDGYTAPGPGCAPPFDCAALDPDISPYAFEDADTVHDENCNGRLPLTPLWAATGFPLTGPGAWTASGTVLVLPITGEVRVGDASSGVPASLTRAGLGLPVNTSLAVSVSVTGDAGTGLACTVELGTVATPFDPTTFISRQTSGIGLQVLSFQGLIGTGRILREVRLQCGGHRALTVDWLQIQDSLDEVGPMSEAHITWKDTRNPGADAALAVVVDDEDDVVWVGTDAGGLARKDANGWHPQNGTGEDSLMMGGSLGVSDILPMVGSDDVYVLAGDAATNGPVGGFWHSPDNGESWAQLGSSIDIWPPAVGGTGDHDDDVAGYGLESNNKGNGTGGLSWEYGGGRRLQGHSLSPVMGEPIYVGNGDWDNLGVSVYGDDGTGTDTFCPMPTTGDALPADRVGALLRLDVPIPDPTDPTGGIGYVETLIVGFRGRTNGQAGLYVCDVTGGVDCSGAVAAYCEVVDEDPWNTTPAWDLSGVDVRDLQEDLSLALDTEAEPLELAVYVADGGSRPVDAGGDGIGDVNCSAAGACTYDSSIHKLWVWYDDATGGVVFDAEPRVADEVDLPLLASGKWSIAGVSMDPFGLYLFAAIPGSNGWRYSHDRLNRIPATDVGVGVWESVNGGDPAVPYDEEDPAERQRAAVDTNFSGSHQEAQFAGEPNPFPARSEPGKVWDVYWMWEDGEAVAVVPHALNLWRVDGLYDEWTDGWWDYSADLEPEGDVTFTYWPTIDEGGNTFQGWPVFAVAIGPDGHLWSGAGDQALTHMDGAEVFDPAAPNGAELDCLWAAWKTSVSSISVAPKVDPQVSFTGDETWDPDGLSSSVVWVTLSEPSWEGNVQNMGVARTLNHGVTWRYAAAGWGPGVDEGETVPTHPDYGLRRCEDNGTELPDHYARQFESMADLATIRPPSNAFSTAEPGDLFGLQGTNVASLGSPRQVQALNEYAAIVLFRATENSTDDGTPDTGASAAAATPDLTGEGGLYLTINGGSTWHEVEFDGGAGDCDPHTVMGAGSFELIHPGTDSSWDNETGTATFELLFTVREQDVGVPTNPVAGNVTLCSMARVTIVAGPSEAVPGDPYPVGATWSWYTYPNRRTSGYADADYCGVTPWALQGAVPSATSNEAVVFGAYHRAAPCETCSGAGYFDQIYGGACLFDLDQFDLTAGAFTQVVDPTLNVYSIQAVASHPQIADTWAIVPTLDAGDYLGCASLQNGPAGTSSVPAWTELACDYPWPLLLTGTSAGYVARELTGPAGAFGVSVPTSYPAGIALSAMWSEVGVPDDSDDGYGSYLVVGTQGQGARRGELSW